jgi:hypothetical protein
MTRIDKVDAIMPTPVAHVVRPVCVCLPAYIAPSAQMLIQTAGIAGDRCASGSFVSSVRFICIEFATIETSSCLTLRCSCLLLLFVYAVRFRSTGVPRVGLAFLLTISIQRALLCNSDHHQSLSANHRPPSVLVSALSFPGHPAGSPLFSPIHHANKLANGWSLWLGRAQP